MLTKDLVQATVRNGRLYPKFLKTDDQQIQADAQEICGIFEGVCGRIVSDVEEDLKEVSTSPRRKGFAKLMMDQCEVAEPSAEITEQRWKVFETSESLRQSQSNVKNFAVADLEQGLINEYNKPIDVLRSELFSDLPSARTIDQFETITAGELISKYNLSHVTTFLCFVEEILVTVSDLSLAQKRELMRRLKFHRLMSDIDIDKDANQIRLELSGSLRLFGRTQGYALRIANFFPFIASLGNWSVESIILWRGKRVEFLVDYKSGIKGTSNRAHGGYIPKEFELVINALNESTDLKVRPGDEFFHLGKQSYCFPDFMVTRGSDSYGIELFHPWHKHQFRSRIEAAKSSSTTKLLVGVDRSLTKDPEIKALCASDPWFLKYGFEYTQFPTPNVIRKAVERDV